MDKQTNSSNTFQKEQLQQNQKRNQAQKKEVAHANKQAQQDIQQEQDQLEPTTSRQVHGGADKQKGECKNRVRRQKQNIEKNIDLTIHADAEECDDEQWYTVTKKAVVPTKWKLAQEVVHKFKKKSCVGIDRGTLGSKSIIETNYFTMDLSKMPGIAYHYDITISPDRPKKLVRKVFDAIQQKYFPNTAMAFDGAKNCYAVQKLDKSQFDFKIEIADNKSRMKEFTIKIKETDTVEVELKSLKNYHRERIFEKPMRALQALEVVLSHSYYERGLKIGRQFYYKPKDIYDLGYGYEMYIGLYQAAILGEKPLLNIDIAHKAFLKVQSVLDFLRNIGITNFTTPMNDTNLSKASFRLVNTIIKYEPPKCFGAGPKYYKILRLGKLPSEIYFTNIEGVQMSVSAYYKSRGYTICYPNLHCIETKSGDRDIALPMELCQVADYQLSMRKETQTAQMVKHFASSSTKRKEKIMNLKSYFQAEENLLMKHFGVCLGQNFIKIYARQLPSPDLQYAGCIVKPQAGSWQITGAYNFFKTSTPEEGHKWAIIYDKTVTKHEDIYKFQNEMYRVANSLNVKLMKQCEIKIFSKIDNILQELAERKFSLVIVVLSSKGPTTYATIKHNAEIKHGVLTQCIKLTTISRALKNRTICNNLLLKINAKLNGTNHKLAEHTDKEVDQLMAPLKNAMFLGADVTHPTPDQKNIPSVVGVAASHDLYGACYNTQYRLQKSNVEHINDMESIMMQHLLFFKKAQTHFPDYIIYYRDGVSDGEYPIIRDKEIRGIRAACKKVGCHAKVTCIVVVKRHHTRFFPLTTESPENKFNNVEPGTIVDQRIVHPNEVEFYLVSHQAIQGTVKPTRYNVIEDDAKFKVDLLQLLTYHLCHMFPRCNRAVSYPVPAYLAHLVAYRGRIYLEGGGKCTIKRTEEGEDVIDFEAEYKKRLVKQNIIEGNPMYFV